MKLGTTFLSVLLVAAGLSTSGKAETLNDDYWRFVRSFKKEHDRFVPSKSFQIPPLTIEEVPTGKGGVVATCLQYKSGELVVKIVKDAWVKASEVKKEITIFHELGHCFLNLEHGQGIMVENSGYIDEPTYASHRDLFLYNLFTY